MDDINSNIELNNLFTLMYEFKTIDFDKIARLTPLQYKFLLLGLKKMYSEQEKAVKKAYRRRR